MRNRYLDLQTGMPLSTAELLRMESQQGGVWEAADEMRSLLADMAQAKEEEAQALLQEAEFIRGIVDQYEAARQALDSPRSASQEVPIP